VLKLNEASMVKLIFQIASKLAQTEIEGNKDLILTVLKQAVVDAQEDDSLTIRLAKRDFEFIEESRARIEGLGDEYEKIRRAKLEANEDIVPGGCVIVTSFGQVDATVEKRIEKVWSLVSEKMPKVSDVIQSDNLPDSTNE
ncbi:MAG: FliH/SctL family protein, partial [Bdellovibrionales bacterium]|jgi:flagellar assembly protein FliH|nr:FliH/SctL family protein [Bdellovibrionales bacterium]